MPEVKQIKQTQNKRIQKKVSNLKSIAFQNNIDVQMTPSQIDTEGLVAIKLEIEKKLKINIDKKKP